MFNLKSSPSFAQSTFADNDNLFAAEKRVDHYRPFLESYSHTPSLGANPSQVEPMPAKTCAGYFSGRRSRRRRFFESRFAQINRLQRFSRDEV